VYWRRFTDVVGSTEKASELGDDDWNDVLARHHGIVREQLERHGGREVKVVGDGFLATFDSPAKAIRCARAITTEVPRLGIEVRAGVHTGECEVTGGDLGGITVHIGARVADAAGPRQVMVSGAVRDMLAGSSFHFHDQGVHQLKGVEGEWRLYSVEL
jgi:class 3 adenylate cyclase